MLSAEEKELLDNSSISYEEFILKYSKRKDLNIRLIAEQLRCRKSATKKLPLMLNLGFLFTKLSLEQSSSEVTARYKASVISGDSLFECTTGIGSDLLFFSKKFGRVYSCELNSELYQIVFNNFKNASIDNVSLFNLACEEVLRQDDLPYFDWIYADPSRRSSSKRVITLSESMPNIPKLMKLFEKRGVNLLLKLSPLYDITRLKFELSNIYRIEVVSVDGEVKEILVYISFKEKQELQYSAVLLSFRSDSTIKIEAPAETAFNRKIAESIDSIGYFYEPDPAIIKSGLSCKVAQDYDMFFINGSVDYLVSDILIENFPGRIFKIEEIYDWNRKSITKLLKSEGIKKVNIARRDFPLSPEELYKYLKVKPGGSEYLFFTRSGSGKKIVVRARKPYGKVQPNPSEKCIPRA